ncbi:MAG: hypothetical protein AB7Q00_12240 [Phycisphaerales bacterium]
MIGTLLASQTHAPSQWLLSPTLAVRDETKVLEVAMWLGVTIVLVLVGAGIGWWIVRRAKRGLSESGDHGIFEDLRRMRDRGQITPEEYEATRRVMVERLKNSGSGTNASSDTKRTR